MRLKTFWVSLILIGSIAHANSDLCNSPSLMELDEEKENSFLMPAPLGRQEEYNLLDRILKKEDQSAFNKLYINWNFRGILEKKMYLVEKIIQCNQLPEAYYVKAQSLVFSLDNIQVKTLDEGRFHLAIYNYLKAFEGGNREAKAELMKYFKDEITFPKADDYFQQYCMNK